MAKIKTFRYAENVSSLIEDPIPGSDLMYMMRDAYDKNTLSPLFDKGLITNTAGTDISEWGVSYGFQPARDAGEHRGGRLILTGETTSVSSYLSNRQGTLHFTNNMDPSPFISMDPANRYKNNKYWSDGTNAVNLNWFHWYNGISAWRSFYIKYLDPLRSLDNLLDAVPTALANIGDNHWIWPVYLNSSTGNIVVVAHRPDSNRYNTPSTGSRLTNVFAPGNLTYSETGTNTNGYSAHIQRQPSSRRYIGRWRQRR
jgi:hypothetical protein